jgi:hypothetical protein
VPRLWEHPPIGKAALISFVEPAGLWRNLVILDGRDLYRIGVSGKAYFDAPDAVDRDRLFEELVGKPVRTGWTPVFHPKMRQNVRAVSFSG